MWSESCVSYARVTGGWRGRGGPFGTAVPTDVVVSAVAIRFAVGLVMLTVVRNEVVESKSVVAGDEVDAGVRLAAAPGIQVAAATGAGGEFRDDAAVPFPEMADTVAVFAVPFRP